MLPLNVHEVLQPHWSELLKNTDLESPDLLAYLYGRGILTANQKDSVERTSRQECAEKAVEKLLKFVAQKGKAGLVALIEGYRVAKTYNMAELLSEALQDAEKQLKAEVYFS